MRSTPVRSTCVAAVVALALAACGGSPTADPDTAAGPAGEAETNKAEAAYAELSALTGQQRRD